MQIPCGAVYDTSRYPPCPQRRKTRELGYPWHPLRTDFPKPWLVARLEHGGSTALGVLCSRSEASMPRTNTWHTKLTKLAHYHTETMLRAACPVWGTRFSSLSHSSLPVVRSRPRPYLRRHLRMENPRELGRPAAHLQCRWQSASVRIVSRVVGQVAVLYLPGYWTWRDIGVQSQCEFRDSYPHT
jgi:hypothetical protein